MEKQYVLEPKNTFMVNLNHENEYEWFEVVAQHAVVSMSSDTTLNVQVRGSIVNPPEWGAKKARGRWFMFNLNENEWYATSATFGTPEWVKELGRDYLNDTSVRVEQGRMLP